MNNAELLARLDKAFKAISIGDLNEGVLVADKFDRFVQVVQHSTVILEDARFIEMQSHQVEIDRVGFIGRILRAAVEGEALDSAEHVKPNFYTNKLIAQELQAITGIKDQALRRNIERGNFEDTLIDLFGEAAGRDLEEWFILGDKAIGDDAVLKIIDGWAKLAENKIYGSGGDANFDPDDKTYPENMFEAMLSAVPKQYFQNPPEWKFYVDWETQNAYYNLLKDRGTNLGDRAWTEAAAVPYKGVPVTYVPMMERSQSGHAGDIAMLQHPDNMVWGLFHEITVEKDRIPKERKTDFVLTLEGDCNYEDENAAVVAFIDKETPGS